MYIHTKMEIVSPSCLVEPDYAGDTVKAEVREVGLWTVERVAVLNLGVRVRPAEGKKATRHQPVEVTVLHLLVVFVLLAVKVLQSRDLYDENPSTPKLRKNTCLASIPGDTIPVLADGI
jgi:hypothetical protein